MVRILFLISFLAVNFSCSKSETEQAKALMKERDVNSDIINLSVSLEEENIKSKSSKPGISGKDDQDLSFVFMASNNQIFERFLEYEVSLTYKVTNFKMARINLLNIVNRFGYIRSSSASSGTYASMNAEFAVKSPDLYHAVIELDQIGKLEAENISTVDHTEKMVLAKRKAKRDMVRTQRKNLWINQLSPLNSNWSEREMSLERSEDSLDNSEHQQWQVLDNVSWAKIRVNIVGPKLPEPIEIPSYQKAFAGIINFLLVISYGLVLLLPLIIIILIVWFNRKKITGLWKKNKE